VTSGVVLVLLAIGGRRCVRTTLDVGLHRCWQLTTGGKKVSVQRRMEQRLRHEGQARDNEDECSTWCTRPRPFHSPYPRRNEVARCGKFSAGRHITDLGAEQPPHTREAGRNISLGILSGGCVPVRCVS